MKNVTIETIETTIKQAVNMTDLILVRACLSRYARTRGEVTQDQANKLFELHEQIENKELEILKAERI